MLRLMLMARLSFKKAPGVLKGGVKGTFLHVARAPSSPYPLAVPVEPKGFEWLRAGFLRYLPE